MYAVAGLKLCVLFITEYNTFSDCCKLLTVTRSHYCLVVLLFLVVYIDLVLVKLLTASVVFGL